MAPLDFLAAVLPSSGFYCVAELSSNKKEHRYVTTIAELEEIANGFDASHKDAYFALASFEVAGERKADKALYLRSCFFDIDCGEGKDYPNKKEALGALVAFLQDTELGGLGTPWVVSSGGGIHVYWPFTTDIPAETWRSTAENLKRLAKSHNFAIDPSVTADRARVLRVPGTHNYKKENPRPVTIVMEGGVFDFEEFSASLKDKLNGHAYVPDEFGLGARPSFADSNPSTSVKLLVDNQSFDFEAVQKGCAQVQFYIKNAADDGMEPTWRAVLSQAWCCDDGKAWGKKLSDMHPYDDQRFEAKWNELNGAYSCEKMDSVTPGICQGCPHKGKIKNPIALGKKVNTIDVPIEVVVDKPAATQTQVEEAPEPIRIKMPTPPRGFSYGGSSGVYYKKTSKGADGETLEAEIMILPYYMYAVDVYNMGGNEHLAHYVALTPHGAKDVMIDTKSFAGKDEVIRSMARQNIIAFAGKGNDEQLYNYVRGCYSDMSLERPPVEMPQSYGWNDDNEFVLNSKIYKPDGTIKPVPVRSGMENIYKATESAGNLKEWQEVVHMMQDKGLTEILTLGLSGFGTPLMALTAYKGITYHACSTESGTGKSLSLDLNSSIWGNPTRYAVSKDTSVVAMEQRLGMLKNLPLNVDEITAKNRGTGFEWVAEFILGMTKGQGKERMESGTNAERLNNTRWAATALLSSNTHIVDFLTGSREHSSEGELRRLLEFPLSNQLVWTAEQSETLRKLQKNYGVAGVAYIKWLVRNRDHAIAVMDKVLQKVEERFNMSNDERFWTAGVASIIAGIQLANEAGVVKIKLEPIVDYLKTIVASMRAMVRASYRQADDVLFTFISRNYSKFVTISKTKTSEMIKSFTGSETEITRNINEVVGRIEKGAATGYVEVYIRAATLKGFCASQDFGYADMKRQLEAKYRVGTGKKDLTAGTKAGAPINVQCLHISLPENDFDAAAAVSVE